MEHKRSDNYKVCINSATADHRYGDHVKLGCDTT